MHGEHMWQLGRWLWLAAFYENRALRRGHCVGGGGAPVNFGQIKILSSSINNR